MEKNLFVIKKTVLEMGGTFEDFLPERSCFYINVLGKRFLLDRKIGITRQSFVSGQLTRCKDITTKLLQKNDLPTPQAECFYRKTFDLIKSKKQLDSLKYPIIIKDACGSNSKGIFVSIPDSKTALNIIEKELPLFQSMIAQEMVFGKEYRILVLGNKVIGALEMILPSVVGDGKSTIRKLIIEKQNTTEKRTNFNKSFNQILKRQRVTLETIVPKKKIIFLKNNSCLAEGGETRDVTDLVNKEVQKICVKASKVVGKNLVGVDVICKNIANEPTNNSFHILEINGMPDLYIHYNPTYGKTRNVVKDIVKFMAKLALPSNT